MGVFNLFFCIEEQNFLPGSVEACGSGSGSGSGSAPAHTDPPPPLCPPAAPPGSRQQRLLHVHLFCREEAQITHRHQPPTPDPPETKPPPLTSDPEPRAPGCK